MTRSLGAAVTAAALFLAGCGSPSQRAAGPPAPIPRRAAVWLGPEGIDLGAAAALAARGVDQVVVRRGSASLAGGVPVLRLVPSPPVSGSVPAAVALRLEGLSDGLDPALADVLWQGLVADFGSAVPAELLLDLPRTAAGLAGLIERLARVSSVPVVPVLMPEQLDDEEVRTLVRVAGGAVIPAFGTVATMRKGAVEGDGRLADRLATIAELGVRVRIGIVLDPTAEPPLARFSDGIEGLLVDRAAEWTLGSGLERALVFRTAVTWNGRAWRPGERVSVQWLDAVRLDAALGEVGRMFLPEVGGWDLISLPPLERSIGLTRDALLAYLAGDGPAPRLEVTAERRDGQVSAILANPGPFSSALSNYDNWLEIDVEGGTLVADDRGDFDRISLGARGRDGAWRRADGGGVTAVQFGTQLVGPQSRFATGSVRLPRRQAKVTVRWQIVLSTGEEVRGSLAVPQ